MPGRSPLRNGWSPGCGTPVRSARNAPLVTIVTAYWDALNAILAGALRLRQSATTEAPASAMQAVSGPKASSVAKANVVDGLGRSAPAGAARAVPAVSASS